VTHTNIEFTLGSLVQRFEAEKVDTIFTLKYLSCNGVYSFRKLLKFWTFSTCPVVSRTTLIMYYPTSTPQKKIQEMLRSLTYETGPEQPFTLSTSKEVAVNEQCNILLENFDFFFFSLFFFQLRNRRSFGTYQS